VRAYRDLLAKARVGDVMNPSSVSVSPSDLVTRARKVMRSTGLHTLPVVAEGRLEGIITIREILRVTSTRSNIPVSGLMLPPQLAVVPEDDLIQLSKKIIALDVPLAPVIRSPSDRTLVGLVRLEDLLNYLVGGPAPDLTVRDVMSRNVVTCDPEDGILKVWARMEETGFSGIPVTRYNRQKHREEVIGMVTRMDVIKSGAIRPVQESGKGRNPPVESIMRTPPITISPDAKLKRAVSLMARRRIGRLPVVERGAFVGIVDREDVIKPYLG